MNSYSYDQQPADLKISVTLRASPDKVADLYAKFGRLDTAVNQVVSPVVNQQVKVVFGRSTAVKAIQERGALNSAIRAKALGTNPNLVTLVQAERWNGVLPTTMVPGSSVPFVSVK